MIKNAPGRIVVEVEMEGKNKHRFANGTEIALVRGVDNFNRRYTEPVNAKIVASDNYVPRGTMALISHKATQEMYRIYNWKNLSGKDIAEGVRHYAIPECDCYAWLDGENWKPGPGYEFGLRVYRPYDGLIVGMPPKLIKNVLWVTSGKLCGNVVHTLVAADYCIIFQGLNGQEQRIIRFRHWDEEDAQREEVICINHDLTSKVNSGELLVGLDANNCKQITAYEKKNQ